MKDARHIFSDAQRKALPPSAVVLLSLDEMVARIEAIRLEAAPAQCPTCGGKRYTPLSSKRCSKCMLVKPTGAFGVDYTRGRPQSWCRQCKADGLADRRRRKAIRALRRAS